MSADLTFDQHLQELVEYHQQHGDCLVPTTPGPNLSLGVWVAGQREEKQKFQNGDTSSTLNLARVELLDRLGFVWDPPAGRDERTANVVSPELLRQSEESINNNVRQGSEDSSSDHDDKTNNNNEAEDDPSFKMARMSQGRFSDAEESNDEYASAKGFSEDDSISGEVAEESVEEQKETTTGESSSQKRLPDAEPSDDNSPDADLNAEKSNGDTGTMHDPEAEPVNEDDDGGDDSKEAQNNGSPKGWEHHFHWLERHMQSLYPNGGYVAATKDLPATPKNWIVQQRYQYRRKQRGLRVAINDERIQKLESIGFCWEKDEPIERKNQDEELEESNAEPEVPIKRNQEENSGSVAEPSSNNKDEPDVDSTDSESEAESSSKANSIKNDAENEESDGESSNEESDDDISDSEEAQIQKHARWDHNFIWLKRHMQSLYPDGGFVIASKDLPPTPKNWINQQRYQYRRKQEGRRVPLNAERIQKLESIGFWWEKDEPIERSEEEELEEESNVEPDLPMERSQEENSGSVAEPSSSNKNDPDVDSNDSDSDAESSSKENNINIDAESEELDAKSPAKNTVCPDSDLDTESASKTNNNSNDDENEEPDVKSPANNIDQPDLESKSEAESSLKETTTNDAENEESDGISPTKNKHDPDLESNDDGSDSEAESSLKANTTTNDAENEVSDAISPTKNKDDPDLASNDDGSDSEAESSLKANTITNDAENEVSDGESSNEESDDDSDSEEEDKVQEKWDRNFIWLQRHMTSLYPKGGYVAAKTCPPARRNWMMRQRYHYRRRKAGKEHEMTAKQIQRLESLGFWWEKDEPIVLKKKAEPKRSNAKAAGRNRRAPKSQWDRLFDKLKMFMKNHGIYETGGFVDATWCKKVFSDWVIKQRDDYGLKMLGMESDITDEQIEKLESIGFHWRRNQNDSGTITNEHPAKNSRKRKSPPVSRASKNAKAAGRTKKSTESTWEEHFEKLRGLLEIQTELDSGLYPCSKMEDPHFYYWCAHQRRQAQLVEAGKKSVLTEDQVQRLKDIGFLQEESASESSESSDDDESDEEDHSASASSAGANEEEHSASDSSSGDDESSSSDTDPTNQNRPAVANRAGTIPWRTHYEKLVRFMRQHCPEGGFVRPPSSDAKFANWVYAQRSIYRKDKLLDDRVEMLNRLGFLWEEPENEEESEEESKQNKGSQDEDESESEMEEESSSEEEDVSEQEETDSSSTSSEEEEVKPSPHKKMRVARRIPDSNTTPNSSAYESLEHKELARLFVNQLDHVELLRKENAELQTELKASSLENEEYKTKLSKSKEKNTHLKNNIKDLKHENQKLENENFSLTQCNQNLRRSHKESMLEERACIQRETKRRKLAEDQLEKAKKLIPFELDSAMLR